MKDKDKTKDQLINELVELRQRVSELEVTDIKRKRAEEALRESEAKYRQLVKYAPAGIYEVDITSGEFLSVNDVMCEYLGYSREELLTMDVFSMPADETSKQLIIERAAKMLAGEAVPETAEYKIKTKDGREIWGLVNARVRREEGTPATAQAVAYDITERKRAEEVLEFKVEQLAALSQASQVVTASLELDQVLAEIVSLASEVVASDYTSVVLVDATGNIGRSAENLPGVPGIEYRIRDKGLTSWIVRSRQAGVIDEIGEDGAIIPDLGEGAPRFANPPIVEAGVKSVAGLPLMVKDRLLGVLYLHSLHAGAFSGQLPLLTTFANQVAIAIDNARLYEAVQRELTERKQVEEELRSAHRKLQTVFDAIQENMSVIDFDFNIRDVNSVLIKTFGLPARESIIGRKCFEVLKGRKDTCPYCPVAEAYRTKAPVYRTSSPEEEVLTGGRSFEVFTYPAMDEHGNPVGVVEFARDITERKRAEEEIRRLKEFNEGIVQGVAEALLVEDATGIITFVNPALEALLGYTADALVGRHWQTIVPKEEVEQVHQKTFHRPRGVSEQYETRLLAVDGTEIPVIVNARPLFEGEIFTGVLSAFTDITERKRAEEELRESEERFRAIFEGAGIGISLVDKEGRYIETNPALQKMLGYGEEELRGMAFAEITHPDDAKVDMDFHEDLMAGKLDHFQLEKRYIRKDGRLVWVRLTVSLIRGAGGEPQYDIGMVEDITERKRAEEALQESEKQFRELVENANDIIYTHDLEGNFTSANPAATRIYGYTNEEILQLNIAQIVDPEYLPLARQKIRQKLEGAPWTDPYELLTYSKEDEPIWVEVNTRLLEREGHSTEVLGIARDFTKRKRAEEALRESEERYRSVVEYSHAGILIVDDTYRFTYVNDELCRILGYSREEIIGQDFRKFLDDESRELVANRYVRRQRGEEVPPRYEFNIVRKDGEKRHVEISSTVIEDSVGKAKTVAQILDITERKRTEALLQASARQWRTTFDAISDPVCLMDLDGSILRCNTAMTKLLGKPFSEIIGRTCWELVHGTSEPIEGCPIMRILETRCRATQVLPLGDRWFNVAADPLLDEADGLIGAVHIMADITERKRAEEELQRSFERLQKTLEGTVNTLVSAIEMRDPYTAGHQRRVPQLACAIAKEMGLPEERIEGIRMAGLIHDLGKINVPAEILSKPGSLSDLQFGLIKMHPQVGHDVLKTIDFPWPVAQIVLQHHERMDGSGYPQGLSGEEILLEARILGVADVVEAMASHRPYRSARGIDEALEEISANRGVLYDSEAVDACLRLFTDKGFRFE